MAPPRLNLPLFKSRTIQDTPGALHHIVRTLREWGRSLDEYLSKADATPWKPVLTAVSGSVTDNPALGTDGSSEGWYSRHGDMIYAQFVFRFLGSNIRQGAGQYRIPVPVRGRSIVNSSLTPRGEAAIFDASLSQVRTYLLYSIGTALFFRDPQWGAFASAPVLTNANIGLTFATGDLICGQVMYHRAKPRTLVELD